MPMSSAVPCITRPKRSMNSAKPMPSCERAMTMPPNTPAMSAKTVSSGNATASASTLGTTSRSSGSMPIVRIASISSVTTMVPICAA